MLGVALVVAAATPAVAQDAPHKERVDPREITPDFRSGAVNDRGELGVPEDLGPTGEARGADIDLLKEACEVELALSAAPDGLRDGAGIYVLRRDGYKRIRSSSNGFDCIVDRDYPQALKPTCFDAEGAAAIVPKIVSVGEWMLEGVGPVEIERRLVAGFESGHFRPAERAGVAYMLSNFNRPWNPHTQSRGWLPPHVMFYAPHLSNADIGFDPATYITGEKRPLIAYEGPHGYMVMVTGETRPRADNELKKCPAWVWE